MAHAGSSLLFFRITSEGSTCSLLPVFLPLTKNKYVLTFPGSNIMDQDDTFSAHMHAGSYLQF